MGQMVKTVPGFLNLGEAKAVLKKKKLLVFLKKLIPYKVYKTTLSTIHPTISFYKFLPSVAQNFQLSISKFPVTQK